MKAQVMKLAHQIAKSNKYYRVAEYRDLLRNAVKMAWEQVKSVVSEVKVDSVIEFAKSIPACFAYEQRENIVVVTYRGKKSEGVSVDLKSRTVKYWGKVFPIASQIASKFNFSII